MIQPPKPSSEATQVEQSRAIAQVQGALVVAQQRPRDTVAAVNRMKEACAIQQLAEHAFFRFPRGGEQISGPSIHLATELARCWGNIDYGVIEMRRDDVKGESEMMTYAWDLETNTRVVNNFIVPHKRDKKGGPVALVDMREIYENNANAGARRLRECIFRVLPKYYVETAKAMCTETLKHGGGVPVEVRRANVIEAFDALKVTRAQIEKKMGRPADKLTAEDLATLGVVYKSIKADETTIRDEFPVDESGEVSQQLSAAKNKPADTQAKKPQERPESPSGNGAVSSSPNESAETDSTSPRQSEAPGARDGEEEDGSSDIALPILSDPPAGEEIKAFREAVAAIAKGMNDPSAVMEFTEKISAQLFAIEKVNKDAAQRIDRILQDRIAQLA